jgi:hypothetical protein
MDAFVSVTEESKQHTNKITFDTVARSTRYVSHHTTNLTMNHDLAFNTPSDGINCWSFGVWTDCAGLSTESKQLRAQQINFDLLLSDIGVE